MSQQKPYLIVKISSNLSTAIFDCRICGNWQMDVYLMSAVKHNLVTFHSSISTQTPLSATPSSAIQFLADTHPKDIRR